VEVEPPALTSMAERANETDDIETKLLQGLSDDVFRKFVYASAQLLQRLRTEATRRGIWDDLKKHRLE
jgi:hypothetical protein